MKPRKLGPVDKFVEEYGLKHNQIFEDYRPGDEAVSLKITDLTLDEPQLSDLWTIGDKLGVNVWVEVMRVTIIEPDEEKAEEL